MRLRFVTGDSPVSAAIRAAEYGFWASHVEAVMPGGALLGAHLDGGVLARPAGYDAKTIVREQIVDLRTGADMDQRFYDFLRLQLGKPYDATAVLALPIGRDWREADSWFCSELQAAALEACGFFYYPLAADASHITPRDLLLIVSGRVPA